ncbi:TPA: GNAT family N-acetyltransferase [Yersinia enterocolitica]|nr:GNAT family N-acetyltransferase [Yersinia enterocolitica]HDL7815265.1 GNAT family N-acetyltransferase [Yersinia enterocolitica]HDL7818836.1 GNAT family N-acetyltransferase [Yersinia enterocolitica]HDL7839096.1 GNAT family N-acetyltransferase [Yersinia enterocolitica]HDL7843924.1 GNAT family N-acetyltransferase [Yersinia enterocolitica]
MEIKFKYKKMILIYSMILCSTAISREIDSNCTKTSQNYIATQHHDNSEENKVCLFTEDKLQGESMCFSAGESIDFEIQDDEVVENDTISSIYNPSGKLVTIYKHDNYNPPYFNLIESIGESDLASFYMDNAISSVKVAATSDQGCYQRCVIRQKMELSLPDIFASFWDNIDYPNNQVLLSFDINGKSDFMAGLPLGPIIWVSKKEISIFGQYGDQPIVFYLHPDTDRLSLLFHLNDNNIAISYMESRGTEQIALSPSIGLGHSSFNKQRLDSRLTINNNASQPLIIDQIVIAASAEDIQSVHHRSERDTAGTLGCTFIPALAIYNYVTHSHCNQGDILWHKISHWFSPDNKDKTVLAAGDSSLLKPHSHSLEYSSAALTLAKIETQLHNQALTLPATAQFCKTSMDNILATRYPRDIDMHCSLWVSRVLADFTLLFGNSMRDWTLDVLRRVLTQIYENDTTGFATSDPAAESRLVNEVQAAIRQLGIDETIRQISQAFDYARLNYARYLAHNPAPTQSPLGAQRLPLGTYSLSLASYHYPTDRPAARVLQDGEWVTRPDLYFDIDILDTTIPTRPDIDAAFMDDALAAAGAWLDIYNASPVNYHITNEPWSEHDRTIEAGRVNSYFLYSELLDAENDYVYAAVRLEGDIVSILAARRDESFENSHDNYYIEFFVTDPNHVLLPEGEGSIRGAGSAALHGLAHYLQQHGVSVLRLRAPSQPAARVTTKLGFQHDEF